MAAPSAEAVSPPPSAAAELAAGRSPAIISPLLDLLCVGGLSIIVLVPLLLSGREELGFVSIGALVWAQALINYTHFMASYRIIYRDRQMILRHKWASIWVPLILLGFAGAALALAPESELLIIGFFAVASGYLAWHYTGQAWGMMASHAYLEGIRFERVERLLIRASLRIMLAWHVSWFLHFWFAEALRRNQDAPASQLVFLDQFAGLVYQVATYAAIPAFLLGAYGLLRLRLRTGRLPPLRAVVAWLAIFVWYAALWRWGLPAFFFIQLAHALQYLEFPARVELNRTAATRRVGHMLLYGGSLLAVSFLVVLAVPGPAMSIVSQTLGMQPNRAAAVLVLYFINIHHYFTDGVVWKLSNPEVRKELFAHVAPVAPVAVAAAPPTAASRGKSRRKRA